MFSYIAILAVIILFVQVSSLRNRIRLLERNMGVEDFTRTLYHNKKDIQKEKEDVIQKVTPEEKPLSEDVLTSPVRLDRFSEWLKEDWMLKVGALFLIIGFGWFTTYAFMNDWIGPVGRITLGIVVGMALMVFGWIRARSYVHQGSIFLVLGSTIILLTIFAAREVYGFFTPISALSVMFLSTAFVALMSTKYKSVYLALSSLALAGVAPLLVGGSGDAVMLFSYLLVVVLGTVWVVGSIGRSELAVAALMLISFYSAPYIINPSTDTTLLLPFAYIFSVIFFFTNIITILKKREGNIVPDLIIAGYTGLFLLAWIFVGVPDEWKSVMIAAWLVVFAVASFVVLSFTKRKDVFLVYGVVALTYLASATGIELNGPVLTMAYTLESAGVVFLTYYLTRNISLAERSALLLIGPAFLSLESLTGSAWRSGFLHEESFTLFLVGVTLFGVGMALRSRAKVSEDDAARKINAGLIIAGSAYGFALLWKVLHSLFISDHAVAIFLIIATIVGITTYVQGVERGHHVLRRYGVWVLIAVVGRLFIVDVWNMEIVGRIITFFVIGTLLASTAFIGRRMRSQRKDSGMTSI